MKSILLTANYVGAPLKIVRELLPPDFALLTMTSNTQDELKQLVPQADYILASGGIRIGPDVLDAAEKLKMIQRVGVGLDSLDLPALHTRNIPVYVNRGVNTDSVAEHAVMFILASLRKMTLINTQTKRGTWKKQEQGVSTRELATQTVGLIGMGSIGQRTAAILKAFGCKMLYSDPNRLDPAAEIERGIEYRALDDLLSLSDVITLHCPLTEQTKNLICAENIRKMRDQAIIINTSRGKLVCEEDLLDALDEGKIAFAALDVFQDEPSENRLLLSHGHVICTPHIAGNTYDSFRRMMQKAMDNIWCFDRGFPERIADSRIDLDGQDGP